MSLNIGILALQGNFSQHAELLSYIQNNKQDLLKKFTPQYPKACSFLQTQHIHCSFITKNSNTNIPLQGLIIPGGESTTMIRLLNEQHLANDITTLIAGDIPLLATCAGCILLSKNILTRNKKSISVQETYNEHEQKSHKIQSPIAQYDIQLERNSYGRQVHSFFAKARCVDDILLSLGIKDIEGCFIRSPRITDVGKKAKVLFYYNEDPVVLQIRHQFLCTFHPEAVNNTVLHILFLLHCARKKMHATA